MLGAGSILSAAVLAVALLAADDATAQEDPGLIVSAIQRVPGAVAQSAAVIQDYSQGLTGVRAANPAVRLSVGRSPALASEQILTVEYPAPTGDPAGRDVQCIAQMRDWTSGRGVTFQVRPDHALRLSVSFLDRNSVVYTAWRELKGDEWQQVRIGFDEIRPNPFFQPPGAKTGAPIDVSDVRFIAFAPQDKVAGRLSVGRILLIPDP